MQNSNLFSLNSIMKLVIFPFNLELLVVLYIENISTSLSLIADNVWLNAIFSFGLDGF